MSVVNKTLNDRFLGGRQFFVQAANQIPDYVLARAAAKGATSAIADLYQRHSGRVYSQCLRMTHNVAEAEDLTQEVFLQLIRKIDSFRGESQFSTWLYRLTVNHVLMHFRRNASRRERVPEQFQLELSAQKGKISSAKQFANKIALDAAVAQLPSGCRAVFFLFDVEGYKHNEIAQMLGYSVGNSKSQLHKARKKLRRLLAGNGVDYTSQ